MDRRSFIRGLIIGGAVAAVPEPIRTYFFAPPGGWNSRALTYGTMLPSNMPQMLSFHKDAFSLAMIDAIAAPNPSLLAQHFDVLYGMRTLQPAYAGRITDEMGHEVLVDQPTLDEWARKVFVVNNVG